MWVLFQTNFVSVHMHMHSDTVGSQQQCFHWPQPRSITSLMVFNLYFNEPRASLDRGGVDLFVSLLSRWSPQIWRVRNFICSESGGNAIGAGLRSDFCSPASKPNEHEGFAETPSLLQREITSLILTEDSLITLMSIRSQSVICVILQSATDNPLTSWWALLKW